MKKLPLSLMFAGKAVVVIWGIIFGTIFFNESITMNKALGAFCVVLGIIIMATDNE